MHFCELEVFGVMKKEIQTDCKPGSVPHGPRAQHEAEEAVGACHLSRMQVSLHLNRSTLQLRRATFERWFT